VRKALKTSFGSSPAQSDAYPSSPSSSSSSSSSPTMSPDACRVPQGSNATIKWVNYGSSLPPKRAYKRTAKTQISPSSADGKKRKWVDYSPRGLDGDEHGHHCSQPALVPQMPSSNGYPSLEMELMGNANAGLPDTNTVPACPPSRKRSIQLDTILDILGKSVPQPYGEWGAVVPQPAVMMTKRNMQFDESFLELMGSGGFSASDIQTPTFDVSFPTARGRRQSIQLDNTFLQYLGMPEADFVSSPEHCVVPSAESSPDTPRRRSIQLDPAFFEFLGKQITDPDLPRDANFPAYAVIHRKTAQEESSIIVTRKGQHDVPYSIQHCDPLEAI